MGGNIILKEISENLLRIYVKNRNYIMELTTKISNGVIKLPKKYKHLNNKTVTIMIREEGNKGTQIEKMKAALDEIIKRDVFKGIEDPVKWQRELRNEWE